MKEEILGQWARLYHAAMEIGYMEPWALLSEGDAFVYVQKDTKKELVFSILGQESPFCGIACYSGWGEFSRARHRLSGKNSKDEPLFDLQNALIGIWGSRKEVSKGNYEVLKTLNLRGHGDGSWLHFEKYREGYVPQDLDEAEVTELAEALENLYMMLRALYEERLSDYKPGMMVMRWYDEKTKLYYTHPFPMQKLFKIAYPQVEIKGDELFQAVTKMPFREYSLALDWSYIPLPLKDAGKEYIPRLLLGADQNDLVLLSELIVADQDQIGEVLGSMYDLFESAGKPRSIKIYDEGLEGILADLCKKLGISLVKTKNLPQIKRLRKELLLSLEATHRRR